MGSDSIQLREVRIRMSGTASNGNFGNLSPDVTMVFSTPAIVNWDEAVSQMISTTHRAFIEAAAEMVSGFANERRDSDELLRELGVRLATEIAVEGDGGYDDVLVRVQDAFTRGAVPLGAEDDEDDYLGDEDDDDFDDDEGLHDDGFDLDEDEDD